MLQSLYRYFVPDNTAFGEMTLLWMVAIFVTCLVVANLVGSYLFLFELPFGTIVGSNVVLSAGIIPFPITFILTDLLNEFYGQKMARFVTLIGFGMAILTFVVLRLAEYLPSHPDSPLPEPAFLHFSSLYTGMFMASLTAYLIGQLLDINIFHWFKKVTGSSKIWLRAQGSTVISQLFDSVIVTFIAFSGTLATHTLWQLAFCNYVWKFMIVVAITPLLYLGHAILKKLLHHIAEE